MVCRKPAYYWPRRLIKYICSAARPEAQKDRRPAASPGRCASLYAIPPINTYLINFICKPCNRTNHANSY